MELWKALAHLYPDARQFTDYEIRMSDDGLPFVAVWNLPQQLPTEVEMRTAITAYDAAEATRKTEATALRQQVVSTAQGAVGKAITALTAAEVRVLVALLLYKEGALSATGAVRPLGEWMRE